MCFMTAMELGGCFLFLRKDFTQDQICITANILNNAVFFTMVLVNCLLLSLMMAVNFMWVTVQLRKEKIKAVSFFNNQMSDDAELNSALLIVLGFYTLLFVPPLICFCLRTFINDIQLTIAFDVCMLLFFFTTLVNPFIYNATVNHFRQEYKKLLRCKTTEIKPNRQIELRVIEC